MGKQLAALCLIVVVLSRYSQAPDGTVDTLCVSRREGSEQRSMQLAVVYYRLRKGNTPEAATVDQ